MDSQTPSESPSPEMDLLFFSGLAAAEHVFAPQLRRFPQLVVAAWPTPNWNESVATYCRRLMEPYDSGRPLVLGGASFGGIVAQWVAQNHPCRAVVLLGSVRGPSQLPVWVKIFRPAQSLIRFLPVRFLQGLLYPLGRKRLGRWLPIPDEMVRQFCQSDPRLVVWSIRQILLWQDEPVVKYPVYHMHGSRDAILPIRKVRPDCIVSGGGHVLTLSHTQEVNQLIQQVIDESTSEPTCDSSRGRPG